VDGARFPGRGTIKAVIFDWGGTLTPWHEIDLREQWRVYSECYCAGGGGKQRDLDRQGLGAVTDLTARILHAETAAWQRMQSDGTSARLVEILAEAGVESDHPGYGAAQAAYEEYWEPHTLTDPQVPGLFEGLHERGVRIGVLSNTIWSPEYHRRVFTRDGVIDLIDGAVYSSQIDHAKPHREAFHAAVAAVGVQDPATCLYVGDRLYEDIHGAQRAGLRAALVPHSSIPDDQQVPVAVEPDAVLHRLGDLLSLLDTGELPPASAKGRG
jgi:putative hydrolase of the HAD superfamily